MLFEIKHQFSGSVLFALETENMRLCVEAAIKRGADLRGAYLRGAYLRGAYLRGADLRGADLRGADLRGADLGGADLRGADLGGADLGGADLRDAKIRNGITITKAPIQVNGLYWHVTIWDNHMQVGCEFHSHDEWAKFSDDELIGMGGETLFNEGREQFKALLMLCASHKPKEST